ncbi:MAG: hypothetical protein ACXVCP_20090 [Bdellovibrio sp.]
MKYLFVLSLSLTFCLSAQAERFDKLKSIPNEVVKYCYDSSGRIADKGQQWEVSDSADGVHPRSVLVGACKHSKTEWSILCQKGGYASTYLLARAKKEKSGWKKIEENQSPNQPEMKCP